MSREAEMGFSLSIKLRGQRLFFGPGVAELLDWVEKTHSLRQAAEKMHMAYSKAWHIVKSAEADLGFPLLERQVGGPGGGGSRLTPDGRRLLESFQAFRREVESFALVSFRRHFPGWETDHTALPRQADTHPNPGDQDAGT